MIQFWLDNFMELFNPSNLSFDNKISDNYIKSLNIVALISIIIGTALIIMTKKPIYFGLIVIVLSLTIYIKSNINHSSFTSTNKKYAFEFDTGASIVRNIIKGDNQVYVDRAINFNQGDIIYFKNDNISETNIVSEIKYTMDKNAPVLVFLNNFKNDYDMYTTILAKVSDSSPNIISPPDGNRSINQVGDNTADPYKMVLDRYPKHVSDPNRSDMNLELATLVGENNYNYQGPPYGSLECRNSSLKNPMGSINVSEYDEKPSMYGTCNVGQYNNNKTNDYIMTNNQEATVSQGINDLLFHKGNSQNQFTPVSVDTLPNDQEAFAHFCYRSPTNLINPKYASIFVNEPEKYKLVSRLARATGTENGGAGGR